MAELPKEVIQVVGNSIQDYLKTPLLVCLLYMFQTHYTDKPVEVVQTVHFGTPYPNEISVNVSNNSRRFKQTNKLTVKNDMVQDNR